MSNFPVIIQSEDLRSYLPSDLSPDEPLSPQYLYWAERLKRAEYRAKQAEFEWAGAQRLKKLVAERWRPGIYQEQKLL